jgi:hypothetical protein
MMFRFSRSCLVSVVLGGTVALLAACSPRTVNNSVRESQPAQAAPAAPKPATPTQAAAKSTKPTPTPAQAAALPDPYNNALDKASSARSISQSAQSPEDWSLAASRWQQAIALLKQVPASSPNKKQAKVRLAEYERNLLAAKKRTRNQNAEVAGNSEIVIDPVASNSGAILGDIAPQQTANGQVYRVWIKYRRGRIPIIDVTFNGKRKFEMMVDTGASGTMITQEMAAALGVEVVGEIPIGTASGKALAPVGYIRSIEAGGAMVTNVPVTIGPLDVGLLGHDFFGDCEITIKQDVVEFRQCGA